MARARRVRCSAVLILFFLCTYATHSGARQRGAPGAAVPASGASTVFDAGVIVPGDGSPALANASMVVQNGRIVSIGASDKVIVPPGAARVSLAGKTMMPTLVNTHGHPGFQKGQTYGRENYTRETYLADLDRAAFFGVGVVMSQGIDPGAIAFDIRRAQQAGQVGGARLLLAGRGIGAPNAGPGAAAFQGIAYEVTTPEAGTAAVRELAAQQVDIVKIWVDDRGGRAPRLAAPVYRAIIEESHRRGLKVNAHVFYHEDAVGLVEAGIDGLAHLVRDKEMDDGLIRAIVQRGVYVMPNLSGAERGTHAAVPEWFDEPALMGLMRASVPPPVIARIRMSFTGRDAAAASAARERYAILQRSLAKLNAAGARIILGSDTGLEDHLFGYAEQRELEEMVRAGMTPAQTIVAATSRAAEYLALKDGGTLAAGRRADFMVLSGNPLADIRQTRRIEDVYLAGRRLDRAAIGATLVR